jgi:uncharacterized protein YqeY
VFGSAEVFAASDLVAVADDELQDLLDQVADEAGAAANTGMGGLDGGAGDENRGREDGGGLHFGGLC